MVVDIAIIGSGMGGATLAAALAPTGCSIVILERGGRMPTTPKSRDPYEVFAKRLFRTRERYLDGQGKSFNPGNFYWVGGNSKMYGAALLRYRAEDFKSRQHIGGQTPSWPLTYAELEPYYQAAEALYEVRGQLSEDASEPFHSEKYTYHAVPDEPVIADFRKRLQDVGLHPASLPLAVDIDEWLSHGKQPFDGFPNNSGGKNDAETVGIRRALQYKSVILKTHCFVEKLIADQNNRIQTVCYSHQGQYLNLSAKRVVCSAGAINTAALLLRSANDKHPNGLANRSDQLGRNFMNHNCSAILALHPLRKNASIYQKTLMINDFYSTGGPHGEPLGNIQLLGKISGNILASQSSLPVYLANWIAQRSIDCYAMSEDLPHPDSRVTLKNNQITLDWRRSNDEAHRLLVRRFKRLLQKMGFPIVLSKAFDHRTLSHQCGTARMGHDANSSVVNADLKSHDHTNLYIVDASVLPTSAAVNPGLTIAALALRTAKHLQRELANEA